MQGIFLTFMCTLLRSAMICVKSFLYGTLYMALLPRVRFHKLHMQQRTQSNLDAFFSKVKFSCLPLIKLEEIYFCFALFWLNQDEKGERSLDRSVSFFTRRTQQQQPNYHFLMPKLHLLLLKIWKYMEYVIIIYRYMYVNRNPSRKYKYVKQSHFKLDNGVDDFPRKFWIHLHNL